MHIYNVICKCKQQISRLVQIKGCHTWQSNSDSNIQHVLKTVGDIAGKGKTLVTIIFYFSHDVFKSLLFQGCFKLWLCGKGLKEIVEVTVLMNLCYDSTAAVEKATQTEGYKQS